MVYSLTYRRPHVPTFTSASLSSVEKQKSIEESSHAATSGMARGTPPELSFDRIVSGACCPPMSLRDFLNYMKYIELTAENLQFFLWYRNYSGRFSGLPEKEQSLSPKWSTRNRSAKSERPGKKPGIATAVFSLNRDLDNKPGPHAANTEKNPFFTPPQTADDESKSLANDACSMHSAAKSLRTQREDGPNRSSSTGCVQPYRDELARIVSIYIAHDGPRQLNLSAKERNNLLFALQHTTHPSAFQEVVTTIEWSLRCQSHPAFVKWAICNGNPPRQLFAKQLGALCIVASLVTAIVLTLSSVARKWRGPPVVVFFLGVATTIAAWKGMCVVLHGFHHRHLRPWELFASEDEYTGIGMEADFDVSLESQHTSNSWEDEPWVAKYTRRNICRKVFDREVWIQEPALRQIQDTIFLQAIIVAALCSSVFVALFFLVPKGEFF